jgi:septum formation protein
MNVPKKIRLILGSSSPRRLQLLAQIGITPDIVVGADIDETPRRGEVPEKYCERVAMEKNLKLQPQFADDFILTADSTVALGRRILGKAENVAEAEQMLRLLSGRTHCVITAVTLKPPGKHMVHRLNISRLTVKRLSEQELQEYLVLNEWPDRAGAFSFQQNFAQYVSKIQGSYTGIVGLPLYETAQILKGAGYDY